MPGAEDTIASRSGKSVRAHGRVAQQASGSQGVRGRVGRMTYRVLMTAAKFVGCEDYARDFLPAARL